MGDQGPVYPLWLTLSRFVHRELIVLGILCGVALGAFVLTRAAAEAAENRREGDARVWHERGLAHLQAREVADAVEALGRARALDRGVHTYHFDFARALAAADRHDAARQVLLTLRETRPEDPDVNLGLARLEAEAGNVPEAIRFYQSALYGAWLPERLGERRAVRRTLIEYLIDRDMRSRAVAELLLLEADLPDDDPFRLDLASLLLDAGDARRALAEYQAAIARDAGNPRAHAGAARAAFAARDFAAASRHLSRLPRDDESLAELRELTRAVLAADPLAPRLRERERIRRLAGGIASVSQALTICFRSGAPLGGEMLAGHLTALQDLNATIAANRFAPETLDRAVAIVARAADAYPPECGTADPAVRAWSLIGRAHPVS